MERGDHQDQGDEYIVLEETYFGPKLSFNHAYLVSKFGRNFKSFALSSDPTTGDSTGLRLYTGGHVAVRFVHHVAPDLLEYRAVIELGCGLGLVGLLGCHDVHLCVDECVDSHGRRNEKRRSSEQEYWSIIWYISFNQSVVPTALLGQSPADYPS